MTDPWGRGRIFNHIYLDMNGIKFMVHVGKYYMDLMGNQLPNILGIYLVYLKWRDPDTIEVCFQVYVWENPSQK